MLDYCIVVVGLPDSYIGNIMNALAVGSLGWSNPVPTDCCISFGLVLSCE